MFTLTVLFGLVAFSVADDTDFIVGGKDVDVAGKYPWQISLQKRGSHICGGALVAENWVATAAHCVEGAKAKQLTVVTGLLEREWNGNSGTPQVVKVSEIHQDPEYPGEDMFMTHDIALLKLKKPVNLNENVKTIAMAEDGDDFEGQSCVLTGWGRYDTRTNDLADNLQELSTKVISRQACQKGFKSWGWNIFDSHICFKVKGATACHGDSGGPAICKKDNEWTLVGVTSGGSPYCTVGKPNIYTRISSYRDFIKEHSDL